MIDWFINNFWVPGVILGISLFCGWGATYFLSRVFHHWMAVVFAIFGGALTFCLVLWGFSEIDYRLFQKEEGFSRTVIGFQLIGAIIELKWALLINVAVAVLGHRAYRGMGPKFFRNKKPNQH